MSTRFWIVFLFLSNLGLADITEVTKFSCAERYLWIAQKTGGPHEIYQVKSDIKVDDYLPNVIPAFKTYKENTPWSLKKFWKLYVLYQPPMIHIPRKIIDSGKDTLTASDLKEWLGKLKPGKIYNLTVTGEGISFGRIFKNNKFFDGLLSKHALLANLSEDLRFAGEFWIDADGTFHFNNNSGSYAPKAEVLEAMEAYLRAVFNDPNMKIVSHDATPPPPPPRIPGKPLTVVQKFLNKVDDAKAIDGLTFLKQVQMIKMLKGSVKNKSMKMIKMKDLMNIHPLHKGKQIEVAWRSQALTDNRDLILEKGIDRDMQKQIFQEEESPMKVLWHAGLKKYILFDGNGRFKSMSNVFENNPDLMIEVEHWETDNAEVFTRLDEVLRRRALLGASQ